MIWVVTMWSRERQIKRNLETSIVDVRRTLNVVLVPVVLNLKWWSLCPKVQRAREPTLSPEKSVDIDSTLTYYRLYRQFESLWVHYPIKKLNVLPLDFLTERRFQTLPTSSWMKMPSYLQSIQWHVLIWQCECRSLDRPSPHMAR